MKVKIWGCCTVRVVLVLDKSNYMGVNPYKGELKIAVTALRGRRSR